MASSPVRRTRNVDPVVARERARKAGLAANSTESLIGRLAARAPELTDAQRAKLAILLKPAGGASE